MGLEHFWGRGVEGVVCHKLFALAAIVLVAISLPGCASGPTVQDQLMDARRKTLESAEKSRDKAFQWREDFLKCMSDYAFKNARASASATEIAEAALSECDYPPLRMYRSYQAGYYSGMYSLDYHTPQGILITAHERGEEKARLDAQELECGVTSSNVIYDK